MADVNNGSSNTAIVAILVIIVLVLAFLYYFGVFGHRDGKTITTEERTNVRIEQPAAGTVKAPSSTAPATPARSITNNNR